MTKARYAVHVISDCVTSYDVKKMPEMLAYYTDKGCEVKNLASYEQMVLRQKGNNDMEIRKATSEDIPRIAEILVFSKRKNYRSIFNDDRGSFVDLQVCSLAKSYFDHPDLLDGILVYDDQFVKALISVDGHEIKELYVDPFFEGMGIGGKLLEYAVSKVRCKELWVLDQNSRAKKLYSRHGFAETGEVREVPEAPESGILECKMAGKG
jgi:putative acetyltransferase